MGSDDFWNEIRMTGIIPDMPRSRLMPRSQASLILILVALVSLGFSGSCLASPDATCLVDQPIDMRSEGTVISLPEEG